MGGGEEIAFVLRDLAKVEVRGGEPGVEFGGALKCRLGVRRLAKRVVRVAAVEMEISTARLQLDGAAVRAKRIFGLAKFRKKQAKCVVDFRVIGLHTDGELVLLNGLAKLIFFFKLSRLGQVPGDLRRRLLLERGGHFSDDAGPVARLGLAKNSHRWIPRAVGAVLEPTPFAGERQQQPDRLTERTGQVRHGGVDGDDQVELPKQQRGGGEIAH